ncbi:hypothetical protein HPB47_013592 [Ixodes persulcatus]|uniref:Uncharacterized protein n=1 Tax=Ixodes persulcatus TaxID=34615 RepID=A0AC60R0V3_IXOPE|nr:hypothetical protein HPB47_013592 [Ixodes persulcatus]
MMCKEAKFEASGAMDSRAQVMYVKEQNKGLIYTYDSKYTITTKSDGGGADERPADGPVKGSYPPYLPELPELRVIIEEASGVEEPAEGDDGVSLLGQYTRALPAHRKSTQRLPSTLKQTVGYRIFDHDEVNEVDIIIKKRLEEETVDNDRTFSRLLDGAHKKRFADKQTSKNLAALEQIGEYREETGFRAGSLLSRQLASSSQRICKSRKPMPAVDGFALFDLELDRDEVKCPRNTTGDFSTLQAIRNLTNEFQGIRAGLDPNTCKRVFSALY